MTEAGSSERERQQWFRTQRKIAADETLPEDSITRRQARARLRLAELPPPEEVDDAA